MPYLIDGNNLMHAVAKAWQEVGRGGLCKMLKLLVDRGERVSVVFDGPPQGNSAGRQMAETGVAITYSLGRDADDIIIKEIDADSAPRRLTVVSTDRVIRKAARRRRCTSVASEQFAETLLDLLDAAMRPKPRPAEPREKRHGLTEAQREYWLKEFDIEE